MTLIKDMYNNVVTSVRTNDGNTDYLKGVPSAESSRSVRGLGKGVSGKPYPRLCNARRPRFEPGTFQSQTTRLYRLHRPTLFLKNEMCTYNLYMFIYHYLSVQCYYTAKKKIE